MGNFNEQKAPDRAGILHKVLPEYQAISKAPSGPPNSEIEPEQWKRSVRERRYKSIDSFGDIYLIVNSAAWASEQKVYFVPDPNGSVERDGERFRRSEVEVKIRPPPKLAMTYDQAKKSLKEKEVLQLPGSSSIKFLPSVDDCGVAF